MALQLMRYCCEVKGDFVMLLSINLHNRLAASKIVRRDRGRH